MKSAFSSISSVYSMLRPEHIFAILALFFGFIFLVLIPPLQSPDEEAHFFRAYHISEGNMVVEELDGAVGGYIPNSVASLMSDTSRGIEFNPSERYSVRKTKVLLLHNVSPDREFVDFPTTTSNNPIAYMPQAFGILIGRSIGLSSILILYLARAFNLIFYVIAVYAAIKLLPFRKWAFVFVGLLPMSLSQAASLSTDVMPFCVLALFLSLVLKVKSSKEKVTTGLFIIFLLILTILVLSKQVMLAFMPLVFLLGKSSFIGNRDRYVKTLALIIAPLLVFGFWMYVIRDIDIGYSNANGQNPSGQVKLVLGSPHIFINVLWNTYFFHWGDGIYRSLIGTFGWADTPLSLVWVIIGYAGLFIVSIPRIVPRSKESSNTLMMNDKLLIIGCSLAFILLVNAALYAYYSPVGFKIVYGLQGRYFIPVLLTLLVAFSDNKWISIEGRAYKRLVLVFPILILVASGVTILYRYYIPGI